MSKEPDAVVVVPREPTPRMLRAAYTAALDKPFPDNMPGVYRAMIGAAPKIANDHDSHIHGIADTIYLCREMAAGIAPAPREHRDPVLWKDCLSWARLAWEGAALGADVREDLETLLANLCRWAKLEPDEQPHFPGGMRPFSTNDLHHNIAVLKTVVSALSTIPVAPEPVEGERYRLSADERAALHQAHLESVTIRKSLATPSPAAPEQEDAQRPAPAGEDGLREALEKRALMWSGTAPGDALRAILAAHQETPDGQ